MDEDLSGLAETDLNLMLAFIMVYECKSVSIAARRLGLGQPAVSYSLKKLRVLFDDSLFLRNKKGVIPTSKAHEVAGAVGPAMRLMKQVLPRSAARRCDSAK